MTWAVLVKLLVVQLLKNFPTFYGTWGLIAVFTRALHWSLSSARLIQSIPPHPISPSTYILVILVVSFLLAFPSISYMHSSSPPFMLHVLPISFSLTWSFQLYLSKSTSYEAAHYAVFFDPPSFHLFRPNILLSTLFSNTLNSCSFISLYIN
jgi:hypothetical protein